MDERSIWGEGVSLLEDGPLRRILRERRRLISGERAEEMVHEWRSRGVPEPAISMALKMADRWLRAVTK